MFKMSWGVVSSLFSGIVQDWNHSLGYLVDLPGKGVWAWMEFFSGKVFKLRIVHAFYVWLGQFR